MGTIACLPALFVDSGNWQSHPFLVLVVTLFVVVAVVGYFLLWRRIRILERRERELHEHLENRTRVLLEEKQKTEEALMEIELARDELARSQVALEKSEARYRQFFEDDLTGDFIAAMDGSIVDCNPAFVRIFGLPSIEQAMGMNIQEMYADPHILETIFSQLRQHRQLEYLEAQARRYDGRPLHLVQNIYGVYDDQGALAGIKGYVFDNTRLRQLEEQYRRVQKLETLSALAGGIAHNFNNIFGIIMGYASQLESAAGDERRIKRNAEVITKAVERGAALVAQMLMFARQARARSAPLALNPVVTDVAVMLRETFPKTISVTIYVQPQLPLVEADESQIREVLAILALNSKDAMPGGGELSISTSVVDGRVIREKFTAALEQPYVCISVTDTGVGMSPQTLRHLFEPFFTTKGVGEGTGLGLAVAYGVISSHNGFIDVESEEGRGTTFRLFLPALLSTEEQV